MTSSPVDLDAALKAFKAEFVGDNKHVLDAWLDDGFIVYQANVESTAEDILALPNEYMGVPTGLSPFPSEY